MNVLAMKYLLPVSLLLTLATALEASDTDHLRPSLRRPVALAMSPDQRWLYTANQASGSISSIDLEKQQVIAELVLGGRLSDLVILPGGGHLLATDEQNHRVVVLAGGGQDWTIGSELKVSPFPAALLVDHEAGRCFVSSLWSQAITVIDIAGLLAGEPRGQTPILKTIPLPFVPGKMCLARAAKRLLVADSFGGTLGVVDLDRLALSSVKTVPGHNIRGLALSRDGERVFTSQQVLNPVARSTSDNVHWGIMMSNVLCSFSMDSVCDPGAALLPSRRVTQLGHPGNGSGDPGALGVRADGSLAVCLSGVGQLALVREEARAMWRINVGLCPTAQLVAPKGERIFVADKLSDAVSVVDAADASRIVSIPLGPQRELGLAERGEMLFFDATLSHDGWMSCHSCHTNGHSNGQINDNLGDDSFGAPKRVLSLLGVGRTGPWAWSGKVSALADQVAKSIRHTMHGTVRDDQVAALVAYLEELQPPAQGHNAERDQEGAGVRRGGELFETLDCRRCHKPPTYTSPARYDVGLTDEVGNTRFNPPSLRGVRWRGSFFHDGRAGSLEEVLRLYHHQLEAPLSDRELHDLVQFLRSL